MRNKLSDLNNHLFEQLERLNDDELSDEQLKKEIQRAKAVSSIAANIVDVHNTVINAKKVCLEYGESYSETKLLE